MLEHAVFSSYSNATPISRGSYRLKGRAAGRFCTQHSTQNVLRSSGMINAQVGYTRRRYMSYCAPILVCVPKRGTKPSPVLEPLPSHCQWRLALCLQLSVRLSTKWKGVRRRFNRLGIREWIIICRIIGEWVAYRVVRRSTIG